MSANLKEFATLIHDVRVFIEQEMPPCVREKSPPPLLTPPLRTPPKNETPQPKTSVAPPVTSVPKIEEEKTPKSQFTHLNAAANRGEWALHAMPPTIEPSSFRQKIAPFTSTFDPPSKAVLILPEENNPHRLFLENVSRAVTKGFASATVVLYYDGLLAKLQGKIVLIPLFLLQKRLPQATIHTPLNEGTTTWIALENLDIYAHDVAAKRSLWMSIQHSFQS